MSIKRAGPITGNPLYGLCFKECIQVTKVLDGCIIRQNDVVFEVDIPQINAPYPYRFVAGRSVGSPTINNLVIMPLDARKAKVSFNLIIPISVTFLDSDNVQHTVESNAGLHREVVMILPADSLTPFEIGSDASLIAEDGIFISPTRLSITCCVAQITKIISKVDILVPSYGYCQYPHCEDREQDLIEPCDAISLFPPRI